jgi:hypothetical protein
MVRQAVTSINCPNCRTPFTAPVQQVIDVQSDPDARSHLLSGQLNAIICPHCGFQGVLNTPFLYHDADLELALVYMPMELGMSDMERQQAIGDLTNRLMQQLPAEARKGYLLQPRAFFTVESLVDAMLEVDEATRELVETQQRVFELIEKLRELDPEDNLAVAEFVGTNDDEIDETFFRLLDVMISVAENQGQAPDVLRLTQHRDSLLEKSTVGRRLKAQRAAIETLASNPTRDTLIEQLIATEDETVRQALVTVGRQLLDYAFFQSLTARIDAAATAGDEDTKARLVALRKEVQEIRDRVDSMAMAVLDERAGLLRNLILEDDPQQMLIEHVMEIDDAFLGVLASNIQQAEREGRQDLVKRFRNIGDIAIQLLNELAPPEFRLVNQIAAAENDDQVRQLLEQERERLDESFLELVEQAAKDLEQTERLERAGRLRYAAEKIKELIAD